MCRGHSIFCVLLAGSIGLFGCAKGEPFEYTPTSEMKQGPGLFTGDKGAFYLYGDKKQDPKDPKDAKDETPAGGAK